MNTVEACQILMQTSRKCSECKKLNVQLIWVLKDRKDLAKHAARETKDERLEHLKEKLNYNKTLVDEKVREVELHLSKPHDTPDQPKEPKINQDPEPKNRQRLTTPHKPTKTAKTVLDPPDIDLTAPQDAEPASPNTPRLIAGSRCKYCNKWLPGERSMCAKCVRENR